MKPSVSRRTPKRAVELAREALRADASFAQARYYLALALFDLGQRDEAIGELEQVVAAGPPLVDPYVSLGSAYLEANRPDPALSVLGVGVEDRSGPGRHPHPARARVSA